MFTNSKPTQPIGAYERDEQTVNDILSMEKITHAMRLTLLSIVQISYHTSGKIEGIFSIDSSAHFCKFCQEMHCSKNPLLICARCYDWKQEEYRTNVLKRHALTARILSSVLFTQEELKTLAIAPGAIVRFNSSGDLINKTHCTNLTNIAKTHKLAKFTLWTKRQNITTCIFDEIGKPKNLILSESSPLIGVPATPSKYADIVFTVYPDKKTTEDAIKSGSFECNGRKCKECGYACYTSHKRTANGPVQVAEILRGTSQKDVNEILEELKKYTSSKTV